MFKNRYDAGIKLAEKLKPIVEKLANPVVLAIPKGGVEIAKAVSEELSVPMDILLVKKIPAPDNPELAIGSVSENGVVFANKQLMEKFGVNNQYIQEVGVDKIQEMARERDYYKYDSAPVEGKDVIIVDDGTATGATLYTAVQSIVRESPQSITIAVPVAPNDENILGMLDSVSHNLVVLHTPDNFMSVSRWYDDFAQIDKKRVKELLKK